MGTANCSRLFLSYTSYAFEMKFGPIIPCNVRKNMVVKKLKNHKQAGVAGVTNK